MTLETTRSMSSDPVQPAAPRLQNKRIRRTIGAVVAALAAAGCGGNGSNGGASNSGFGQLSARVSWQQLERAPVGSAQLAGVAPAAGFGAQLPAAVGTVRLDFAPAVGAACCVAIDPSRLQVDSSTGRRRVVLDQIPVGRGLLTIAGFPGSSAAAPAGVNLTCPLEPVSAASPCIANSLDTPSFLSEPTTVDVRSGTQVSAGDIRVPAIPFIITGTLAPRPASSVDAPVALAATVAISASQLPIERIAIATTPGGDTSVTLSPCDDQSQNPCSPNGSLQVRGLRAVSLSANVPEGNATVNIIATGSNTPPLSLSYAFAVSGKPATSSPTTRIATSTPSPTRTVGVATPLATATARATTTTRPTRTPRPTATSSTATATPDARCGSVPAQRCRQSIEANRSSLAITLSEDGEDDRLAFDWERGFFFEIGEFGRPTFETSYALCLYDQIDGATTLLLELFVPPGVDCPAQECWTRTDDGFSYRDIGGSHDGVEEIDLHGGLPPRNHISFRARGRNLVLPALPLSQSPTVIVQLKNDFEEGKCWEARFSRSADRNDSTTFRDRGDPPTN